MDYTIEIEEKVFAYIDSTHMLLPNEKVVVGVSGGADSVCLLFILLEWVKRYPLQLIIVHVNHGIREDAGSDARFVEEICKEHGLEFCLKSVDVRRLAKDMRISEEDAGRRARYEIFEYFMKQYEADKIAVAHNCNDRAETMLFHLFRGSGITGLSSIRPVREKVIRPLLCLERGEIEEYLQEKGLTYQIDATNDTDDYTRNRIRHHILPYAEENIARGCIKRMAQTADILLNVGDYLEQETSKAYEKCVIDSENAYRVNITEFIMLHPAIQKHLLFMMLENLTPKRRDITYRHIESLEELFMREGNRSICLPHRIRCRRQYQEVFLNREPEFVEESNGNLKTENISLKIEPERIPSYGLLLPWENLGVIECRVFLLDKNLEENCKNIPENQYTKWFDYDKIEKSLELRFRRAGDYFCFKGDQNGQVLHKKVKEYMIGEKIPQKERGRILLLAEGSHILWVMGYRISEYYKISKDTKRILEVQYRRELPPL